jgi:polar amino acid transport system substrate-binding protein
MPATEAPMIRSGLVSILAGLLGLGMGAAEGPALGKVRFAIGEWAPYTGEKLEERGMAAELVSAACAAAGLKAEFEFTPWKRAEANVEMGTCFATFPYQDTREREARYDFSDSLFRSSNRLLYHTSNARTAGFVLRRPEDLKGFKVGTLLGADALNGPLRRTGASVEEVESVEQNLVKLAMDRIDFVADDQLVLAEAVRTVYGFDPGRNALFDFNEIRMGSGTDYHLMVSRKYPHAKELLERFNAGLKKLAASGQYGKILKKYGL